MSPGQKPLVLLVDALNLIRRIHAAVPENDSDALLLRCRAAVGKLTRQHNPSHGILVWDGGHEQSWRRQLNPDYKAQRKPMPPQLAELLPVIDSTLADTGLRSIREEHVEADDLIATIASKLQHYGAKAIIVSTDLGYGQLHSRHIGQWSHFDQTWIDQNQLQAKFGVPTEQLRDFWALVGDRSNGIPGVPGIGKKSALELLQAHANLEHLLQAGAVSGKLGDKLQQHQATARLSYQLATLKCDLNLKLNLNQFRLSSVG